MQTGKNEQMQAFYAMESALLAEFQKLQGPEDGEQELGDLENDPLLAADFDIGSYFNSKYTDEKSLENVMQEIQNYDTQLVAIDQEMKQCIRQQAYSQEQTREQLSKINDEAVILIEKI